MAWAPQSTSWRTQVLVVDAQSPLDVGTVVLDDDVGVAGQPLEDGHAVGIAQVERHAALVAMQVLEVEPVAIAAHAVARPAARHLDLDGPSAPVDELAHARGTRPRAGEVEHGEARERERRVVSHGSAS